jgi:formylglycine-generating enzyme required for sulfatase activity
LLNAEAQAYLSDFGLMRAAERTMSISQMTQSGNLQGTAEYMSPEQANGQEASPRSDVYSLAIVAYEMLTAELPFTADQPLAVLKMHTDSPPPNPILKRPDLPAALAAELMKALAKRAADRHASAGAFTAALQSALSAEEKAAAEATLRARQMYEGAVAHVEGRIVSLEHQMSVAQQEKLLAESHAKHFEEEATVVSKILEETKEKLKELREKEKQTYVKVKVYEAERHDAETRRAEAQSRLNRAEHVLRLFQESRLQWITIPSGEFLYGDNKVKRNLSEFQITKYPVTNEQYFEFITATNYAAPKHWRNGIVPPGLENHPVVYVSWDDAHAFCKWASCRLPTEEEWEKAARGTDGRKYPWGNESPDGRCNFCATFLDWLFGTALNATSPVFKFSRGGSSPYGCIDMVGNVWEWTADCVLRGGSWGSGAQDVRVISRSEGTRRYARFPFIGFRPVR